MYTSPVAWMVKVSVSDFPDTQAMAVDIGLHGEGDRAPWPWALASRERPWSGRVGKMVRGSAFASSGGGSAWHNTRLNRPAIGSIMSGSSSPIADTRTPRAGGLLPALLLAVGP